MAVSAIWSAPSSAPSSKSVAGGERRHRGRRWSTAAHARRRARQRRRTDCSSSPWTMIDDTLMASADLLAWIPEGHPDEMLVGQVNFERLPAHIAIIMDGNGRWAAQRHLPRVEGHRAGIDAVRDTVETAARLGINVLTLYAFSIENWKRPATEISTLMMLLKRYLRSELSTLLRNNIRFQVIGRKDELSTDVQHELDIGIRQTAGNSGMRFN